MSQIQRATKRLEERWQETREVWSDSVSKDFQEKHLEPIVPELRITFAAIQELTDLFSKAEKQCRDNQH
jgi:hypothetical protein